MGAKPFIHVTAYQPDFQTCLDKIRQSVFICGKYSGSENRPASIEDALEFCGESGTSSILDIQTVSDEPELGCASPLATEELHDYFGTDKPTLQMIEQCENVWADIDRCTARYTIIYEGDKPSQVCFWGYSLD